MRFWGARLILNMTSMEAHVWSSGSSLTARCYEVAHQRTVRRRYAAFRKQGLSAYAAVAKLRGQSIETVRTEFSAGLRRRARRWGGYPAPGTRAWVEREAYKLAQKLQAVPAQPKRLKPQ